MSFSAGLSFRIGGWLGGLSDGTTRYVICRDVGVGAGVDVDVHGKARYVNDV